MFKCKDIVDLVDGGLNVLGSFTHGVFVIDDM
jgi:hypothetical protein